MPDLYDGDHLHDDLRLIRTEWGDEHARRIEAFLDELSGNEDALWALMQRRQDRNFSRPFFNSCAIEWMLDDGFNMYRMRPTVVAPAYRMLYAFDNVEDEFHILAIVRKKPQSDPDYNRALHYDYERDHPISIRVLGEYHKLRIPRVR